MNNFGYEKNIKVRYSEMDFNLVLKPSALLQNFQDLASINAEELGFGYSYIIKQNLAWFLLKYRIEFVDYPKEKYDLKIKTFPRGCNKLFAFRDFEVYDNEALLGRAASAWALVDINKKSMVSAAQILSDNKNMPPYEKKENDLVYSKIPQITNVNKEKTFEIRYDDLDVNMHVNNVNYIIWAFETLDFDFRKNKKLKALDIVYKKEIKYGESVLSQVENLDNKTVHVLKNSKTDEDLCHIQAEWIEK